MDGAQVSVLKEIDQVFLAPRWPPEEHHGGILEMQIPLEILGDFTDKMLKWKLAEVELGAPLVMTDLKESLPEFFGTRVGCHVSAVEWV